MASNTTKTEAEFMDVLLKYLNPPPANPGPSPVINSNK